MLRTRFHRPSSKSFISFTTGGHFLDRKPYVFFSEGCRCPRYCKAFHRILLIRLSVFAVSNSLYSCRLGIGMFFLEYCKLNLSMMSVNFVKCSTEPGAIVRNTSVDHHRQSAQYISRAIYTTEETLMRLLQFHATM